MHFVRDAYGNVRQTQTKADGKTSTVTATYDTWGRKTATSDPVKGTWNYTYNAFGELYTQQTARGHTFTLTYDLLGRKIRSYEANEGTLCWNYGSVGDETAHAVGLLVSTEKFDGLDRVCPAALLASPTIRKSYSYDEFSRVVETATKIGIQTHRISQTYDDASRPLVKTFPGGLYAKFSVRNVYNTWGYLEEIVDDSDGSSLRKIDAVDARGQVTSETLGNGVETTRVFEAQRGLLNTVSATFNGNLRHYVDVNFDALGNVQNRESRYFGDFGSNARYTEQYFYDGLNRLKNRYITVVADGTTLPQGFSDDFSYQYDGWGNLKFKPGVGYYKYDGSKVHRLTGIYANSNHTGTEYAFVYDANGNVTSDGARTFDYGSFDKVVMISNADASVEMKYGPDRELYSRVETEGQGLSAVTYTRLYLGDYEKVTRYALLSGASEHKYYVGDVIITRKAFGGLERHYLHKDHQGSVIAITDDNGDVVSQAVYDPFGERLPVYVSSVFDGVFITEPTEMGYTGHRHIQSLGIVDMGGRIYDGRIGRFLQADPFVQFENNSQSHNRYSYVLNNPMSHTDPSGYFLDELWDKVKEYASVIVGVVLTAFIGPASTWYWAAVYGALAGAVGAAVSGGNILTGALIGAVSGAVFHGIGKAAFGKLSDRAGDFLGTGLTKGEFAAKVFAHGTAGGVMSVAQGGKFGHGFAAAGVTQAFSPGIDHFITGDSAASIAGRITAAAVVGGTASELSGGKFANGAVTGAFVQAFNHETSRFSKQQNADIAKQARQMRAKIALMNDDEFKALFQDMWGQEIPADQLHILRQHVDSELKKMALASWSAASQAQLVDNIDAATAIAGQTAIGKLLRLPIVFKRALFGAELQQSMSTTLGPSEQEPYIVFGPGAGDVDVWLGPSE